MSESRSAASILYPSLDSATPSPTERTVSPPGTLAEGIYGRGENAGIEVARSVQEGGVAKPAGETDDAVPPSRPDLPSASPATPFDATKFEGADPALIADFGKLAGKAGIGQETAIELMALHTRTSETYWNNQQADWETAVKRDPEIGGDKLDHVVSTVKEFLANRDLVDPGVVNLLSTYRLGSHPAIIRTLYRLASAL